MSGSKLKIQTTLPSFKYFFREVSPCKFLGYVVYFKWKYGVDIRFLLKILEKRSLPMHLIRSSFYLLSLKTFKNQFYITQLSLTLYGLLIPELTNKCITENRL